MNDEAIILNNEIPWVIKALLIIVGCLVGLIIVYWVIKNNKNIKANAKINNTEIGFSITDGDGKVLMKSDTNKLSDIIPQHIKALNVHPLFITFFNYINHQSNDFLSMKTNMFDICMKNNFDEACILNITKSIFLSDFFIKNYIISFERILHHIVNALETDTKNNDQQFSNTIEIFENILSDVGSEHFLQNTKNNIKYLDNSLKFKNKYADIEERLKDFSDDIFNIILENIKTGTSSFYRDLIILKNTTFSINTDKNLGFIYIINGTDRLLNAFLNYLFTLYFDVKNKIILDIYNYYVASIEKGVNDACKN